MDPLWSERDFCTLNCLLRHLLVKIRTAMRTEVCPRIICWTLQWILMENTLWFRMLSLLYSAWHISHFELRRQMSMIYNSYPVLSNSNPSRTYEVYWCANRKALESSISMCLSLKAQSRLLGIKLRKQYYLILWTVCKEAVFPCFKIAGTHWLLSDFTEE